MRARSSSFSNCVFLKSAACGSRSAGNKSVISCCLSYSTLAAASDSTSASSSSLSSAKSDSTKMSSESISSVTSTGFESATDISIWLLRPILSATIFPCSSPISPTDGRRKTAPFFILFASPPTNESLLLLYSASIVCKMVRPRGRRRFETFHKVSPTTTT